MRDLNSDRIKLIYTFKELESKTETFICNILKITLTELQDFMESELYQKLKNTKWLPLYKTSERLIFNTLKNKINPNIKNTKDILRQNGFKKLKKKY